MRTVLVAVRDSKMQAFGPVIQERNAVSAVRAFGDVLVRGGDSVLHTHPGDHDLYFIGEFDPDTGELYASPAGPYVIINGEACLRERNNVAQGVEVRGDAAALVEV